MSARHQDDDIPGARGAHARGEILVVGAWRDLDGIAGLCGIGRTRECLKAVLALRPSLASLPLLELTYQVIARGRLE